MELEINKVEEEINKYIAKQAVPRRQEQTWKADEARRRDHQREAHRLEWIHFFETLATNHERTAERYKQRAEGLYTDRERSIKG